MTKLRVKLREPQHVYPKVIVVAAPRGRLDHPDYRLAALVRRPLIGRRLDLDRRHHRAVDRHPAWIVVAQHSPRVLVRGGER